MSSTSAKPALRPASNDNNIKTIDIVPGGDLIFKLVRVNRALHRDLEVTDILARFKVSRKAMENSGDFFKVMVSGDFKGASQAEIDLEYGTVVAMELWLRFFHNSFLPESYRIPIKGVWEAIHMGFERSLNVERLGPWFAKYWDVLEKNPKIHKDLGHIEQLLYPCRVFDHVKGFAWCSRFIMYHTGDGGWRADGSIRTTHITEVNLTKHLKRKCEKGVCRQLNTAKGHCRGQMSSRIPPVQIRFARLNCQCHDKAGTNFTLAPANTRVWPFDDGKRSIATIMNGLEEKFSYQIPDGECYSCSRDLGSTFVDDVVEEAASYFEGLCLDCWRKPRTGTQETDYWLHNHLYHNSGQDAGYGGLRPWNTVCRLRHGRNTWYHSFMARVEDLSPEMKALETRRLKAEMERTARKAAQNVAKLPL